MNDIEKSAELEKVRAEAAYKHDTELRAKDRTIIELQIDSERDMRCQADKHNDDKQSILKQQIDKVEKKGGIENGGMLKKLAKLVPGVGNVVTVIDSVVYHFNFINIYSFLNEFLPIFFWFYLNK